MQWGFIPSWAKDAKFCSINAVSETVAKMPMFRSARDLGRSPTHADGTIANEPDQCGQQFRRRRSAFAGGCQRGWSVQQRRCPIAAGHAQNRRLFTDGGAGAGNVRADGAGLARSYVGGCPSTRKQVGMLPGVVRTIAVQLQPGWVINSCGSETFQEPTEFDTPVESQKLKPLTARPSRSGNSTPDRVWHSAVVRARNAPTNQRF